MFDDNSWEDHVSEPPDVEPPVVFTYSKMWAQTVDPNNVLMDEDLQEIWDDMMNPSFPDYTDSEGVVWVYDEGAANYVPTDNTEPF